ncbi:MAG TPA: MFS transporter [Steroidobacteraceae bacterium]|nr:MFS transporter [Steroidobacteraceae bacterium]
MNPHTPAGPERVMPASAPGVSARMVLLLAAAIFINYVDRGNLSTAAPLLQSELHLSNTQIGVLLSAFFWTYAPLQLLAGWMAERLDVHKVLPAGLALWSVATMLSGVAGSFMVLLGLRLVLGLGESVVYPCHGKLLGLRAKEHQRGTANGVTSAGQALGPAFGTLIGGLVMAHYGWRVVMLGFGALSLLWLWPWIASTKGAPSTVAEAGGGSAPSYAMILRRRAARGCCLGHFCSNYTLYFVLGWLPLFLVKSRGFSLTEMSKIGATVYGVYALSCALAGWASDRWLLAGRTTNFARKTFMVGGTLGTAACLLLTANATPGMTIVWLLCMAVFLGLYTPMIFTIPQALAGPRAAGQWMGLQNFFGNLAGILGPILTGILVDHSGGFSYAFIVAAAISMTGALAFGLIVPRIETLDWSVNNPGVSLPRNPARA